MSVTVEWANPEKNIIYFHVTQPWTWQDYVNATDEAWDMLQSVNHIVDYIVDLSNTKLVPSNPLSNLRRGATRTHPHKGISVMVGTSGFMQVIINMMTQIFPTVKANVRTTPSLSEAYIIIAQEQKRRAQAAK